VSPLEVATQALELHLDVLIASRVPYNLKLAEKKWLENKLIRDASGKSHAEKVTNAYASETWREFSLELADLENRYQEAVLRHEVLKADYQTKYLLHKETEAQIRRS
jgi:hypothetical protein